METIKSFTSLEQSKVLGEILPLKSSDMVHIPYANNDGGYAIHVNKWDNDHIIEEGWFPCWSLAALLNYLREIDFFPDIEADAHSVTMDINYYDEEEARPLAPVHNIKVKADTFVDACYEMIIKLHEMKPL